jgi:flagellar assembly protein FliH
MAKAFPKFTFETSFDDPSARRPEAEAPPPEPTFTLADLAAARVEAQALGREEGLAEARAGAECLASDATQRIIERLDQLHRDIESFQERTLRQTMRLAVEILHRMLPALAASSALGEIEATIEACLRGHLEEPRMVVRVADALLDHVRTRIADITPDTGFAGKLILLADDSVAPGDCRVEWADGGTERNSARLQGQIDEALAHFFPPEATPDQDGTPETPTA